MRTCRGHFGLHFHANSFLIKAEYKNIFQTHFILFCFNSNTQDNSLCTDAALCWGEGDFFRNLSESMNVLTTYLQSSEVSLVNGNSDIKCDMRQISCVSVSSGSTLCSCHVLEFHLQISTVSNCSVHLKIVIYFWYMETEEIRLRESFKWLCMLFSFSIHGFP